MEISSLVRSSQIVPSFTNSAVEGINTQQQLLERNVEQAAKSQGADTKDSQSRDKALVEQQQIATEVQANARSLEISNERLGTFINIEV